MKSLQPTPFPNTLWLQVSLGRQRLWLRESAETLAEYPVSTAANGAGERNGSGCTPRGWHQVRARIGAGCPLGTVFVGRRPTGEIYSAALRAAAPARDWILTRILWLGGLEHGRNRLGDVDTLRRYIYIHGTPDEVELGVPGSHGCIRMRNSDLVELFERVRAGTRVLIEE
ncbi:MAG TPA: L,D-transpeptidase [Gammaproteobacteria bacterium]